MTNREFSFLSGLAFFIFAPLGGVAHDSGMITSAASLWFASLLALLCALVPAS